ncbi:MAG: ATP-dependent DNA helicase RecG [Muricoprocola sp.]
MNIESSIVDLKGIGEKTRKVYENAGIYTVGDLLSYYPRTYRKYGEIIPIEQVQEETEVAIYAVILRPASVQYIKRLQMTSVRIQDASGEITARWYHMPYLKNTLLPGKQFVFYGKAVRKNHQFILEQPALYSLEQYQSMQSELQPVYVLSKGLSNTMLTKLMRQVLDEKSLFREYLPSYIREKYQLAEYDYAIEEIHFPRDEHHMLLARKRLVYDEFLFFLYMLRQYKEKRGVPENIFHIQYSDVIDTVINNLGYQLTGAQMRTWKEIVADMTGEKVMARLVQGDVGSGKTIIAFLAMILAAQNGLQSALMVPTEVLARQHFEAMNQLLQKNNLSFQAVFLAGSMTAKEKCIAYEKIASHEADFIIGTHALIQEKVTYAKLGLVITDEQHRFGVRQRESLEEKGNSVHTLVMSATPIPRTLAVILYGDLDISVIDELPSNRIPIKNCVVNTSYRKKAYAFMEKEVRNGHQVYVICPMVEESEMIEAEDVLSYTEKLRSVFPEDICIEYLHGKMKPKEKNRIMERFLNNEIQILVSTTVVEVGVNVPNATVMMIENAERFGLAQLHQLRGRVGRSNLQSYCIMINGSDSQKNQKRLDILNHSNDGFYIASEDLKLRGPGDLLGVRQSGDLEFKIGDIYTDSRILQQASETVDKLMEEDPDLEKEEHRLMKERLKTMMSLESKKLNL